MWICENCIELCEGPAIDIAKARGTNTRRQCEECGERNFCYEILPGSNWKFKEPKEK